MIRLYLARVKKETTSSPKQILVFQFVFLALCLLVGVTMLYQGRRAIRERAYDISYSEGPGSYSTTSVGSGIRSRPSTASYEGDEAVILGVGLMAAGVMLLTWAVGLVLLLLGRVGWKAPAWLVRVLAVASLFALLVMCIGLFPPWRITTVALYPVVAALLLAVLLPIPDAARKKVLPAVLLGFLFSGYFFLPAFPFFAGIFIFIIAAANAAMVFPALGARLLRK